jgi:hypothetical protein
MLDGCESVSMTGRGGNAIHPGGGSMTKVTFFEDYHCFEYHTHHEAPQRFRYFLYSPVYVSIHLASGSSTYREYAREETVFSSDFLPSRVAQRLDDQ